MTPCGELRQICGTRAVCAKELGHPAPHRSGRLEWDGLEWWILPANVSQEHLRIVETGEELHTANPQVRGLLASLQQERARRLRIQNENEQALGELAHKNEDLEDKLTRAEESLHLYKTKNKQLVSKLARLNNTNELVQEIAELKSRIAALKGIATPKHHDRTALEDIELRFKNLEYE
jgi:predicted nuclease with TOPRIM domain